jgi:D-alanyl-D-alanine carboxypeptidase/D-alanyl-D-alanine-endopeptidase (penicillin-binding protein 4)
MAWMVTVPAAAAASGQAQAISERLQAELSGRVGAQDAVMVVSPEGAVLARVNAARPLVPASILKILTALAALENLGPTYRFRTGFYMDCDDNLKIKGYGDPMLVSERLRTIAGILAAKRRRVNHLVLDDSYFKRPLRIPGRGSSAQPYDAPNGALCVNFNTVAFERRDGTWISGEPQTPLLPYVVPKIAATGSSSGRITLAADGDEALTYTGRLFAYFLRGAGIETSGIVRRGVVRPETDRFLFDYRSEDDLSQVVRALLEFSNNFIANQLLLVMGATTHGAPGTIDKGLSVLKRFYRRDLGIPDGNIVEASGISRRNRITAQAMATILERFEPYYRLLRMEGRQYYKTGHLKGIRTRAGYLLDGGGARYRFVVMVNTPGKSTRGIMRAIEAAIAGKAPGR